MNTLPEEILVYIIERALVARTYVRSLEIRRINSTFKRLFEYVTSKNSYPESQLTHEHCAVISKNNSIIRIVMKNICEIIMSSTDNIFVKYMRCDINMRKNHLLYIKLYNIKFKIDINTGESSCVWDKYSYNMNIFRLKKCPDICYKLKQWVNLDVVIKCINKTKKELTMENLRKRRAILIKK